MPTDPQLTIRLEEAEAHASVSCYRAAEVARTDIGPHTALANGVPVIALDVVDSAFFNRALGLATTAPASAATVDAISTTFRTWGRTQSMIQVPVEVTTPELEGWLGAAGYRSSRNWVKLWHDLRQVPEVTSSLRVERIAPRDAAAFGEIVVDAFGMPSIVAPLATCPVGSAGWIHYLGFDGDTPVAAGAMHIDGDTAWLGFGATLEAARGRGGQSAIFAARLRDARDAGCTLAVTETGEETAEDPVNHSYRNMVRLGFNLAYARPNWLRTEPPPAS
jgi:GNAT superfamily N-acetyltransferase